MGSRSTLFAALALMPALLLLGRLTGTATAQTTLPDRMSESASAAAATTQADVSAPDATLRNLGPLGAAPTTAPDVGLAKKIPAPPATQPAIQADGETIRLYARGDYPAVIDRLEPAFQIGAARLPIQERLLLARALLHLDRNAEGKAVLESVLKSDSENPDANFLMGQLLAGAGGQDKQAVEFLLHAARLKKTPATESLLGQCYYRLGETGHAKEHLAAALKEDIRNPANSFLLGKIWLAGGSGAQAERYLLLAQEAGLDSVELHHLLGQAYLLQRKYVGPVLVKRIPTSQQAGDIVGDSVVLRKVAGQADQYLVATRYCALYEGLWIRNFNINLSQKRLKSDGNSEGRPAVPHTIDADIQVDAAFMVTRGWFAAGEMATTGRMLAILQRMEWPEVSSRTLDLLAQFEIATKDFAGLDKTLSTAPDKKVFDPTVAADFYYQAAIALRADGKRAEALAMLKKADAAVPTSANVLRALASLSAATNQLAQAKQYYARIVELFPDAADIDELQNTLRNLTEKIGGGHATSLPDDNE